MLSLWENRVWSRPSVPRKFPKTIKERVSKKLQAQRTDIHLWSLILKHVVMLPLRVASIQNSPKTYGSLLPLEPPDTPWESKDSHWNYSKRLWDRRLPLWNPLGIPETPLRSSETPWDPLRPSCISEAFLGPFERRLKHPETSLWPSKPPLKPSGTLLRLPDTPLWPPWSTQETLWNPQETPWYHLKLHKQPIKDNKISYYSLRSPETLRRPPGTLLKPLGASWNAPEFLKSLLKPAEMH